RLPGFGESGSSKGRDGMVVLLSAGCDASSLGSSFTRGVCLTGRTLETGITPALSDTGRTARLPRPVLRRADDSRRVDHERDLIADRQCPSHLDAALRRVRAAHGLEFLGVDQDDVFDGV